jgi:ESS family glutamate:Na+ symporter
MQAVLSFCVLSLLLVIGKVLRTSIPFLRKLYLPSSLVAGALGLLLLSFWGDGVLSGCHEGWTKLPGFLINIVFATLFIGQKFPKMSKVKNIVGEQLCFGQIVAWGMYVVGIVVTMLVLVPLFGVPPVFGNLIEIGFSGGHGTVGGMQAVFEEMGWEAGSALGYTTATVGMIIGVTVGMALINSAVRKGEVKYIRSYEDLSKAEQRGFYPINRRPAAGMQTVMCDSIDSLAWHLSVVGLAILVGYLLKEALLLINFILPDSISSLRIIESIPLFPLCMIGGLVIQQFLNATRLSPLIDRGQINRIGGASLDFLVVAAVSTIQLKFIVGNWLPLAILLFAGISWSMLSAKFLSKIMFKEDRFERMICEFGQFTGVTATGLLLLRTADPESKTSASTAFGCKQLFHEPIMGGGVWTAMAVPLVVKLGPWWVVLISFAMMVIWWSIWYFFLRKGADKTK